MYISIAVSYIISSEKIPSLQAHNQEKNSIVHYCIIVFIMSSSPYLLTIFIGDEMTKIFP